jgi:hypothetical protein
MSLYDLIMRRGFRLKKFVFLAWASFFFLGMSWVHAQSLQDFFKVRLSWQSVPGAKRYKIQIGRRRNFKILIQEAETTDPEWIWHYRPGRQKYGKKVFYRIASMSDQGEIGKFSSPRTLILPQMRGQSESRSVSRPMIRVPATTRAPEIQHYSRTELPSETLQESKNFWKWGIAVNAGYGNFNQKSDQADLKSVLGEPAYLQQKLALQIENLRSYDSKWPVRSWSVQLQFQNRSFRRFSTPRPYDQPDVSAYSLELNALKWTPFGLSRDRRMSSVFHFGYGFMLDRSFRWIKTGSESVDSTGALSVGPVLQGVFIGPEMKSLMPREIGLSLGAPLSGALTQGQIAVLLSLWSEWNVIDVFESQVGLKFEGDMSQSHWSTPSKTEVTAWALWTALTVHFGRNR